MEKKELVTLADILPMPEKPAILVSFDSYLISDGTDEEDASIIAQKLGISMDDVIGLMDYMLLFIFDSLDEAKIKWKAVKELQNYGHFAKWEFLEAYLWDGKKVIKQL